MSDGRLQEQRRGRVGVARFQRALGGAVQDGLGVHRVAGPPELLAEHRKQRTWLNRLKWAIAYFVVAVADYRITKRLNFGFEKAALPER